MVKHNCRVKMYVHICLLNWSQFLVEKVKSNLPAKDFEHALGLIFVFIFLKGTEGTTYGQKVPSVPFSSDHVKICELLTTEGTDPIPARPALVNHVSQDESQSFPAMQETSAPVSKSPAILFPWIKTSFKGLEAVISCTQKARSLDPNPLGPLAWEVKVFPVW